MNVVFLGPPGSGKGTQAKRLAAAFGMTHVSTGDVFREAIAEQSDLGKQIKSYVDSGKLVPDDLVSEVVFDKLKKPPLSKNFLLDGYPRTIDQAHAFDAFVRKEHISVDAVCFFEVKAEALVKRLSARRQCPQCKEVFNLVTRPPKTEGRCDVCGGPLTHRPDDKEDVVKERLRVYELQTAPILDFYRAKPNFVTIDAAQDVDAVYRDLTAGVERTAKAAR